jgi:hypothetical protein
MSDSVIADGVGFVSFFSVMINGGLSPDWAGINLGLGPLSLLPYRDHH